MSINTMKQVLEAIQDLRGYRPDIDAAINALRTAIQQAESEPVAWSERDQLRHAQAAVVMPMIGPLLDAWENSDREVMSQEPELSKQLKNINSAMEDADTHPAPGVPDDVVRDAGRYRWLRSLEHCNEAWCLIGSGNANSNLDAAIDAAMLAAKTGGAP